MIIKFSAIKEPKISLSCARKLNVGPYPEPVEIGSKLHTLFSKDHFNIILSSACFFFVFLALQPILVVFSQPGSEL